MRKIFKRIFAPALIGLLPLLTLAQNRPVSGIVVNEKGEPITHASVVIKGATQGTTTDEKGEFHLSVSSSFRILVISSLGYASKELPITDGVMRVSLASAVGSLDDVVVIGYGTQKVANVSGAISTIKSADI